VPTRGQDKPQWNALNVDDASFCGIKRRTGGAAPLGCPGGRTYVEAKIQELYDVAVLQYDQYVVPRD
jgi:hypothetical protein